tara:strand:+ start:175 stop:525 length:351 start_codon:yes stop_codon:yes gene_type:complete
MELLLGALQHADIFVSKLDPGAVSPMGLDGARLRENNPQLIACSISGCGEEAESSKKKAYDFLIQAKSGSCSVTGTPESLSRVGNPTYRPPRLVLRLFLQFFEHLFNVGEQPLELI